jgi:arylsulfatase A-like enzyme
MISRTAVVANVGTGGSSTADHALYLPGFPALLFLSAWCGLVAGLLEVTTIVVRKKVFDPDQLYKMSRHFIWLIPLSNLCVFLMLGLLGYAVIMAWPGRGRWLFGRALFAIAVLPSLFVAFPQIYGLALLTVAVGLATQLVPLIVRTSRGFRRFVAVSLPAAVAIVSIFGASLWISDRNKAQRESARPLPPAGSPNVLLIVMDTVAAGHLDLHGYERATSTTLIDLAARGIRFDGARTTSSWTLPSHSSMFTGRWLHELSVGWLTPLDRTFPTLAEYLGDRGYATAGFVANTFYCGTDSGLARGFTRYDDYIFPELTALKTASLVNRALEGIQMIAYFSEDWLESAGLFSYVLRGWRSLDTDRKGAATVNRELLNWLANRALPQRPFFAFLNYYDAHYPYQLPPGRLHRFGSEPTDDYQRILIQQWRNIDKTTLSPEGLAFAIDAYDDCIADLDEQLGSLYDVLGRRGVLDQTWLIIVSDHGESFGEHPGVFGHGISLYETEIHVPLLVIPPGGRAAPLVVKEAVCLRDLAATIIDIASQQTGSPFPGGSLARFWKQPSPGGPIAPPSHSPAFAEVVPTETHDRDYWGAPRQLSPQGSIKEDEWSYIRRHEDSREELFRLRDDPKEQRNLAGDPASRTTLEQLRAVLNRISGGPLSPERFNR